MMYVIVSMDGGRIEEIMFVIESESKAKEFCRTNPGHIYYAVQEL